MYGDKIHLPNNSHAIMHLPLLRLTFSFGGGFTDSCQSGAAIHKDKTLTNSSDGIIKNSLQSFLCEG